VYPVIVQNVPDHPAPNPYLGDAACGSCCSQCHAAGLNFWNTTCPGCANLCHGQPCQEPPPNAHSSCASCCEQCGYASFCPACAGACGPSGTSCADLAPSEPCESCCEQCGYASFCPPCLGVAACVSSGTNCADLAPSPSNAAPSPSNTAPSPSSAAPSPSPLALGFTLVSDTRNGEPACQRTHTRIFSSGRQTLESCLQECVSDSSCGFAQFHSNGYCATYQTCILDRPANDVNIPASVYRKP